MGLYAWPIHDSSIVIQKVETDENGFFKFGFINYGKYALGAIETTLTDFKKQIHKNKYAVLTSDYISLSIIDTAQHVNMLLSQPLERLRITSLSFQVSGISKLRRYVPTGL